MEHFEEMLTRWTWFDVKVELFSLGYDTFSMSKQARVGYRVYLSNVLVFEDSDFFPSPLHSIDGINAVLALLSFFLEEDVMQVYSPEQLKWFASSACEEVGILTSDFEEFCQHGPNKCGLQMWKCPECTEENFTYEVAPTTCQWCGQPTTINIVLLEEAK